MSPELIAYAKEIVAERGIIQKDMTKEIMGDVLKEALVRMEKAVWRVQNNARLMNEFVEATAAKIYYAK